MPRKAKPKLTRDDLQKIIEGKCADVPKLKDWARGEDERRTKAGNGRKERGK